jgi:hypothetical protein
VIPLRYSTLPLRVVVGCRVYRVAVIAIAIALSAGCAARQRDQQQEALKETVSEAKQECNSLYSDPALDPIREKVALGSPDSQTFEMLTNTQTVSPAEKPVVALWAKTREQCWQISGPMRSMLPLQIEAVTEGSKQATDSMIAQLYLGQITYGELANRRAKNLAEAKAALADIGQALIVQNQQSQFQAAQIANQRIEAWNSEMQTQALQEMRIQMSAPVTSAPVTCRTFGNMTNCY